MIKELKENDWETFRNEWERHVWKPKENIANAKKIEIKDTVRSKNHLKAVENITSKSPKNKKALD